MREKVCSNQCDVYDVQDIVGVLGSSGRQKKRVRWADEESHDTGFRIGGAAYGQVWKLRKTIPHGLQHTWRGLQIDCATLF